MTEVWKDVVGFEGCYVVSNFGRVKSLARTVDRLHYGVWIKQAVPERILRARMNEFGYTRVALNKDGKISDRLIHRVVAATFIPQVEGKPEVNHINGVKTDNRVENLEWADRFDNTRHCVGVLGWHGEKTHNAKLRNDDIGDIRFLLGWGVPVPEVAKSYGVSNGAIYGIKDGSRWARVA